MADCFYRVAAEGEAMTIDERIMDTWQAELELKGTMPWYCSMARLRQQDQNCIVGNLTKAVAVCRRYRQWPHEEWETELGAWDPQGVVN
jgi:hypothetical protein